MSPSSRLFTYRRIWGELRDAWAPLSFNLVPLTVRVKGEASDEAVVAPPATEGEQPGAKRESGSGNSHPSTEGRVRNAMRILDTFGGQSSTLVPMKTRSATAIAGIVILSALGCSGGNEADRIGIASECGNDDDCPLVKIASEDVHLMCLTQFTAGYCAIEGCQRASDCPEGATCVAHDDGKEYCFRECSNKSECNANRSPDGEANCSANFDFKDPGDEVSGLKACIPPSSGK